MTSVQRKLIYKSVIVTEDVDAEITRHRSEGWEIIDCTGDTGSTLGKRIHLLLVRKEASA